MICKQKRISCKRKKTVNFKEYFKANKALKYFKKYKSNFKDIVN